MDSVKSEGYKSYAKAGITWCNFSIRKNNNDSELFKKNPCVHSDTKVRGVKENFFIEECQLINVE